jgi:hypothetical protein
MRVGGNERTKGLTHVASRSTASAIVLRRRDALKPCAFGAPFGLRGLTASLRRKLGIDAVNGSLCLSLTRCCVAACDVLAKMTSVRTETFRLTSEAPYKGMLEADLSNS